MQQLIPIGSRDIRSSPAWLTFISPRRSIDDMSDLRGTFALASLCLRIALDLAISVPHQVKCKIA